MRFRALAQVLVCSLMLALVAKPCLAVASGWDQAKAGFNLASADGPVAGEKSSCPSECTAIQAQRVRELEGFRPQAFGPLHKSLPALVAAFPAFAPPPELPRFSSLRQHPPPLCVRQRLHHLCRLLA